MEVNLRCTGCGRPLSAPASQIAEGSICPACVNGLKRGAEPPRSNVILAILRGGAVEASRLQLPSLILLGLSLGDIIVTFLLLNNGPGYYESNPVAQWFLAHWSFEGMFLFKLGAIAGAITLGEIIERRKPGWGRLVLWVGCIASATVVWHGVRLYLGLPGLPFWSQD